MVVEVAKSGHNVTVLLLSSKPKYHRHGQMAVASEVMDPVPRPTPKVAALGRPQGQVAPPNTSSHPLLILSLIGSSPSPGNQSHSVH